ncbi:NRDE family protein [Paenalcaligenes faecalis]|uniref:NRDE family protein n=1 Tax=Paenalcaligenes faecalis TaxID=2980099 RepID=UPI0022B95403|nr:NRDE family protein [Paenalcaligenes faecalis]
MCIAYLALAADPQWPLFIAANRDEFHARPTLACAPWKENPDIIGGRDLQAGGTWFAVHRRGRFALLTNYRDLLPATGKEKSRGALCKDFLMDSSCSAHDYLQRIAQQKDQYQGFNLIVGEWNPDHARFDCYYFSNRSQLDPIRLSPGHYILSNHLLNTPWPKSTRLQNGLQKLVETQDSICVDDAYALLRDQTKAPEHLLPNTGLHPDREQLLSSPFIVSPDYGTRSSSVWLHSQSGHGFLHECSYNAEGEETERHSWPVF